MNKKLIYTLIFIKILILIKLYSYQRYYNILPSLPIHPNNNKESNIVLKLSNNRNQNDIDFFHLTNKSVSPAFLPYVNESLSDLDNIITDTFIVNIILLLKNIFNRARPYQINKNINYIYTKTGLTPSYPAGHAFQAYYLAYKLSFKYPKNKKLFFKIAKKCDDCRIKAGIHYPSDGKFSKNIIDSYFN
jgi:hypothetical protein